jgi:hypothetical protein
MKQLAAALMLTAAATAASAQNISIVRVLQTVLVVNAVTQITPERVRAEADQELLNYARAQGGDATAQNLSRLYQIQRAQRQ